MEIESIFLLASVGLAAGIINTLAGGGSFLTVPVLVMLGLPGNLANGTNRIGVLFQTFMAGWRFRRTSIFLPKEVLPVLAPMAVGSIIGAIAINQISDQIFEKFFGVAMILLWAMTLRKSTEETKPSPNRLWQNFIRFLVGLYGGAFQAGVGILLVLVLRNTGLDLLKANALKVAVNFCFTLLALPIFLFNGHVSWGPALALGFGFAIGGEVGARIAIDHGSRVLRPALGIAVLILAGRMFGLY